MTSRWQSMGAEFLEVDFKESGEGAGGYAKEMSAEWHTAANRMLSKQCEEVDIVITTALIPGKKAPTLITADMVSKLKPGSVCVDLAASAGGNIVGTVKDARFVTPSGVTMLGYTDLNSRLASTSSSLYASHLTKHGHCLHASACTCSRRRLLFRAGMRITRPSGSCLQGPRRPRRRASCAWTTRTSPCEA